MVQAFDDGSLDSCRAAPYLDVLTIHSRRLLSKTREEIAARERELREQNPFGLSGPTPKDSSTGDSDASHLDELLASVRLLLEPVHVPDLSHTGLQVATKQTEPDKSDDVLLFYPTGAKNANMREFIRETLDKHQLLREMQSTTELNGVGVMNPTASLAGSASTPAIGAAASVSKAQADKKRKPKKIVQSPVKQSMQSALLDRELTRQAKDVLSALRANSSKINELIAK